MKIKTVFKPCSLNNKNNIFLEFNKKDYQQLNEVGLKKILGQVVHSHLSIVKHHNI